MLENTWQFSVHKDFFFNGAFSDDFLSKAKHSHNDEVQRSVVWEIAYCGKIFIRIEKSEHGTVYYETLYLNS